MMFGKGQGNLINLHVLHKLRREAGVGFAIKSDLVGKFTGLPNAINDRLMTLRLPLSGNKHATIVSAYV